MARQTRVHMLSFRELDIYCMKCPGEYISITLFVLGREKENAVHPQSGCYRLQKACTLNQEIL